MNTFNAFRQYLPDSPDKTVLAEDHGVIFYKAETGEDWYECQKAFANDTIKIAYDAVGVIRSISKDVSTLCPDNLSVAEVPDIFSNQLADISGNWCFIDGQISERTLSAAELQQNAETQRTRLMVVATNAISPLQDAVEMGMATSDEQARLLAWKQYRVLLSRIDTAVADIEWPVPPSD